MKCQICGNEEFYGHQTVHVDVICDGDGEFIGNANGSLDASTYEADATFGPFTCTYCGAEYDELEDGQNVSGFSVFYAPIKGRPGQLAAIDFLRFTTGNGSIVVEPFRTEAERFEPGHCKPIGDEEILAAIADHLIVRSWLVANADGLSVVNEQDLIRCDEASSQDITSLSHGRRP